MKLVVRIVVSLLILLLATASIANIHTRAVQLHANGGWQTWFISAGFAITFALFAYMLIAFRKGFFLGAAIFGAVLTGVMQTGMYLALGADWFTSLGFGCGGPILEALLAMSEHYMDEPAKKGAPSPMMARFQNAIISRIERPAQNVLPERSTIVQPEQPEQNVQPEQDDKKQRRRKVVDYYTKNPNGSYQAVADELNVNKSVVWNDVKWLEKQGIIHVEKDGRTQTITVNGNAPTFMAE